MMIPSAITLMPQFLIFAASAGLTPGPLWVPAFFGSAFNIFLLRQFFLSIPTELEDAAKIDGCGPFAIYWRVMLPLVKPALAAIAIMGTLGAWNNFQGRSSTSRRRKKCPSPTRCNCIRPNTRASRAC
jgi:multiple sugar transport system permease protein